MVDVLAIQSPSEMLADLRQWWWVYLSMPFVGGFIGWITKHLAIWMMFNPINFVGIRLGPIPLGWQGMVPRRAPHMAAIVYDRVVGKLITPQELFDRIDPDRLAEEMRPATDEMVDEIVREMMAEFYPGLWQTMPEQGRKLLVRRMQGEAPAQVKAMVKDVQTNLDQVIDLKDMVVTNLTRDRALLNRMIRDIAKEDLEMVPVLGFWFGVILGTFQAVVWLLFHNPVIMPLFGFVNGFVSDWIALQMMFRPHEPTRYFGVFTWHGLFAKRREETIPRYAHLTSQEILTPDRLMEALLKGPASDRLFAMAQKNIERAADEIPGFAKPAVVATVGTERWRHMKKVAAEKAFEHAPKIMHEVHGYTMEAMDVENTIAERMGKLTAEEFEQLLRPAIKEDEPLAITVGAMLGFLVGEIQSQAVEKITLGHWGFPFGFLN